MNIKKALQPECISLHLQSNDREGVLQELVDLLAASGRVKDRQAVLKALQERERRMSTGMQNGLAIPHGKCDAVDSLVAAIGLKKEGIAFHALDGQPSTIFVATIAPDNRAGPHIQFLAEISRRLSDPAVREQLLNAPTADAVLEILTG